MGDIKLDDAEAAIEKEVGSRGDAFREANLDRAEEEVRTTGQISEIVDENDVTIDLVQPDVPTLTEPPLEPAKDPE